MIQLSKEITYPEIQNTINVCLFLELKYNHIHTCYCDNKKTSVSVFCSICR